MGGDPRDSPTPSRTRGGGEGLERLTGWVLAHKRLVGAFWLTLTLLGFFGASRVSEALSTDFAMPASESFLTNEEIETRFGGGGANPPLVAVIQLAAGDTPESPGVVSDLRELERELGEALPGARIASYASTEVRAYVSDDGSTTFALAYPPSSPQEAGEPGTVPPAQLEAAERATDRVRVGGAEVQLTGQGVLTQAAPQHEGGGQVFNETLVAGLAALGVLAFVFASALALVPLLMAVVAIPTTMLAVWGLTAITEVSFVVLFLVALIGLGIAIDYALIVVMRWREERDAGADDDEAVRRALATAGRAVVFSGTTVAIGLLAAVVLDVPFLRSMGYGGLLIPLVSVVVALTLLPVVLATLGPHADRRRLRRTERAERHWTGWARLVIRRRWAAATAGSAVLIALVAVASGMLLGQPQARSLGSSGEPRAALDALDASGITAAPLAPIEVLTSATRAGGVARALDAVEGVRAASAPPGPRWQKADRAVVEVFPASDTNSSQGRDTVDAVEEAASVLGATSVGGITAQTSAFVDSVYGSFPLMLALIALVTSVLLARAFRSLLLPLKAVVLNVASVLATWGVMTLVWQHGVATQLLFGADPIGAVVFWAPIIVFAFIYGLSMDYEVFILARMREEYDRTGSTDEAVVRGLARTGRLVTSAALIVFLALASMASVPELDVKVFATGLMAGVLLDALVVRGLLVPAVVSLLGPWNWWLPETARRLLGLSPIRAGRRDDRRRPTAVPTNDERLNA